ncbi:hypothetical protein EVAR_44632_1 [Eumeta japonica]|uniref:Histone-lysine N-methyltransferase SETMAR n=1 Tax=Eumeta variegata TaxID=151549 RepID=A0A4C1YW98_EUMVA|nr:hypothetical protein EVAR_44632_1 [Eumeta japonica]
MKFRFSRPVTNKIATILVKLEQDRHISSYDIAEELKIDHKTVLIQLKKNLDSIPGFHTHSPKVKLIPYDKNVRKDHAHKASKLHRLYRRVPYLKRKKRNPYRITLLSVCPSVRPSVKTLFLRNGDRIPIKHKSRERHHTRRDFCVKSLDTEFGAVVKGMKQSGSSPTAARGARGPAVNRLGLTTDIAEWEIALRVHITNDSPQTDEHADDDGTWRVIAPRVLKEDCGVRGYERLSTLLMEVVHHPRPHEVVISASTVSCRSVESLGIHPKNGSIPHTHVGRRHPRRYFVDRPQSYCCS